MRKGSKFLPEAWTRIGEMHFDAAELPQAISAYTRVLEFTDSTYYDKALYKLAWSYYRDNRFVEAIKEFDRLVKWADAKKSSGDKFGSDLRPEAIQYLGVSFSEPDWNGDTVPDGETGLQRADNFYRGRENEPHVKEVYQRLGEIYFDATQYPEAIAVFKALLTKWPYFADAPKIQDRIIQAYERDRNMVAAAKEREMPGPALRQGDRLAPGKPEQPRRAGRRPAAVGGRPAQRRHQRARGSPGLPVGGQRGQGPGQAGDLQADVPDLGRALREVPERLPQRQAGLRVFHLSRRRPLLLRPVRPGHRRLHAPCATRCWTTASSGRRPST